MRIWWYVEGESDRLGLEALTESWRSQMALVGWGMTIVALENKKQLLFGIGRRAAQKLVGSKTDLVVASPDLYPYDLTHGSWAHQTAPELRRILDREVRESLQLDFNQSNAAIPGLMGRFYGSSFKHDFEALLLAAPTQLSQVLGAPVPRGICRQPVEDQNNANPPSAIVSSLFRTHHPKRRAYLKTKDCRAVLARVSLSTLLQPVNGQQQLPEFKQAIDWISVSTKVSPP